MWDVAECCKLPIVTPQKITMIIIILAIVIIVKILIVVNVEY